MRNIDIDPRLGVLPLPVVPEIAGMGNLADGASDLGEGPAGRTQEVLEGDGVILVNQGLEGGVIANDMDFD